MSATDTVAPTDERAVAVLDLAQRAATGYERPDLLRQVERVRHRVTDPQIRVLVVGEFKQGKSSLVNGLVAAPVCPVDDDVATAVPTAVRHADRPEAFAVWAADSGNAPPRREPIALDDVAAFVSEAGNPGNRRDLRSVEIGLPRPLLASGLVLVDTPGVGGLGSTHSATTIATLPSADAVLLCSDASQELTEPELEFLTMARDLCPTIACVVTKTDFYPEWRAVVELDRAHLEHRQLTAPLIPTSASLRSAAAAGNDRELNLESGYPVLLGFLRDRVAGDVAGLARRAVAQVVMGVADQLAARYRAEREALTDPAGSANLVADLERTQERVTQLRGRAARWQQTLSDGIADLAADADHDLRRRSREVVAAAEGAIANIDPGVAWDDLEQWLYRAVNTEVVASYAMMTGRAEELAARVAEHFAEQQGAPPADVGVDVPLERLDQVRPPTVVEPESASVASRGLTALRGSYGGVMMVGIAGSVLGFGLFNPVSLSFGVVLGRKAIRDERERALSQRRQQARQVCRTYVDDVTFAVSKDARDGLRRLQRTLRDAFTEEAETLQHSTTEALNAARQAVRADQQERSRRLEDVDAELARIRQLRDAARDLVDDTGR
ncbi:MAG: dynamin family protein [Actinobacteria bacterium]|nr:dynamin family protein [Actinomycetota bacterium]